MPLQRCQAETTSTEFLEWQQYARQEFEEPTREELYLAQIAAEMRRFVAKTPRSVHLGQFILPLASAVKKRSKKITDDEAVVRMANSKQYWLTLAHSKDRKGPAQ